MIFEIFFCFVAESLLILTGHFNILKISLYTMLKQANNK